MVAGAAPEGSALETVGSGRNIDRCHSPVALRAVRPTDWENLGKLRSRHGKPALVNKHTRPEIVLYGSGLNSHFFGLHKRGSRPQGIYGRITKMRSSAAPTRVTSQIVKTTRANVSGRAMGERTHGSTGCD